MANEVDKQALSTLYPTVNKNEIVRNKQAYYTGDMGMALNCVKAYENHQWNAVTFSDLSQSAITNIYLNAVQWSNQTSI